MNKKARFSKKERSLRRFNLIAGIVALWVIIIASVFLVMSSSEANTGECRAELALHPLRFRVVNRYDSQIRVMWKYSRSGLWNEQMYVDAGSSMWFYSTAKFKTTDLTNVTVTVWATESQIPYTTLPDSIIQFSMSDLALVSDDGYHTWLRQMSQGQTTLQFDCITTEVYGVPTITFG